MEFLIGLGLALITVVWARIVGFDRERVFFPVLLMVIATYYILFAVIGDSSAPLLAEVVWAAIFSCVSIVGYKRTLWVVVAGLAVHGAFDLVHDFLVVNPGVPQFWPRFCAGFDVLLAGYLAGLLIRRRATKP